MRYLKRKLLLLSSVLLLIFIIVGRIKNQIALDRIAQEQEIKEIKEKHTFLEVKISVSDLRTKFIAPPPDVTVPLELVQPWFDDSSQLDQPNWIQEILGDMHNGFYIESGAFDGEGLSNTLMLERLYNWSGLLIEADPLNFKLLKAKNRRAFSSNTCLSVVEYPIAVSFLQENVVGKITDNKLGEELESHTVVQCFPLYMYLQALNRTTVDYFSLDVEGSELEVLRTIPWDKVNIRTLSVEYSHGQQSKKDMRSFMEEKGYYVYVQLPYLTGGSDFIFVKLSD